LTVPTHRTRSLVLAAMMLTILASAFGPATALAKDPPGLGKFMNAVGKVESGGDYRARNTRSGAFGKYQIMPSNWPSWAKRYLGDRKAKPTPANQERVARGKFKTLYASLHSWRRVAYWWLSGSSRRSGWTPRAKAYVTKVMRHYQHASSHIPTAPGGTGSRGGSHRPSSKAHRISEHGSAVTYTGRWKTARHRAYAGDAVRYATGRGATATIAFTGSSVTWYGPVGPTRGKARISIDGTYVKTLDLHHRSFTAHAAVFGRSWKAAGAHTLTIEVVGGGGHPMIAVDEFVVRD